MKKFLAIAALAFLAIFSASFLMANERAVIVDNFNAGSDKLSIDESGSAHTIDITHAKIHECKSFVIADYTAAFNIAAPKYYNITVPLGVTIHVAPVFVTVDGSARVQWSTNETWGSKGTTLTPKTINLECSQGSTVKAYVDGNTTNASAVYFDLFLVGGGSTTGAQGNRSGSMGNLREEIVIPGGNTVTFKITSQTDAEKILVRFPFYSE